MAYVPSYIKIPPKNVLKGGEIEYDSMRTSNDEIWNIFGEFIFFFNIYQRPVMFISRNEITQRSKLSNIFISVYHTLFTVTISILVRPSM